METPTIESIIDLYGDKPLPPTPKTASSIYLTARRSPRSPQSIQSHSSSSGASTRLSSPLTPIYSRFVTEKDIDSAKRISQRLKRGRIYPNLSHLEQIQARGNAAPAKSPLPKAKPSHPKPVPFTEWKAPPYRPGLSVRQSPRTPSASQETHPKSSESGASPPAEAHDYFSFRPQRGYGSPSIEPGLTDGPADANAPLVSLRSNETASDRDADDISLYRDASPGDPSVEAITAQLSSISGFKSTPHSSDIRVDFFPYFSPKKFPPHNPVESRDENSGKDIQSIAGSKLRNERFEHDNGINGQPNPVARDKEHNHVLENPRIHHPVSQPSAPSSYFARSASNITSNLTQPSSAKKTKPPPKLHLPKELPNLAIPLSAYQIHGTKAWKKNTTKKKKKKKRKSPPISHKPKKAFFFSLRRRPHRKASITSAAPPQTTSITAAAAAAGGTSTASWDANRVRRSRSQKKQVRKDKHIHSNNTNNNGTTHLAPSSSPPPPLSLHGISPPPSHPPPPPPPPQPPSSHALPFELQDDSGSGVDLRALRRKEAELLSQRRRLIRLERESGVGGVPF